jgi:hypothetical protein
MRNSKSRKEDWKGKKNPRRVASKRRSSVIGTTHLLPRVIMTGRQCWRRLVHDGRAMKYVLRLTPPPNAGVAKRNITSYFTRNKCMQSVLSIIRVRVRETFFNLPNICVIKLRTLHIYAEYLVHKRWYVPVWFISWRACEHRRRGKSVRRACFSVCV